MSEDSHMFGNSYDHGVGFHNIGTVLRGASDQVSSAVAKHYGQRCGHTPPGRFVSVLVPEKTPAITDQIQYLSLMTHAAIGLLTPNEPLPPKSLVVPYINTLATQTTLESQGARVWGLPGVITENLKNKADFHLLVQELDIKGVCVPEHVICDIDNLPASAADFLVSVQQIYTHAGMQNRYPLGLMIRGGESDGNYGGCSLRRLSHKPGIFFTDDEDSSEFPDWDFAIARAHQYIQQATDANKERRVVISRFLHLADSPGISLIIENGRVDHLGWNGQVTAADGTACIGTGSYHPQSAELSNTQARHEAETAQDLGSFVLTLADKLGLNRAQLCGLVNFDLMIPGALEVEFQKRLGKPPQITVAECNPRWTNYTDALAMVARVLSINLNTQGLKETRDRGVLTADKFSASIRPEVPVESIREAVYQTDQRLNHTDGSRVILRMATTPHPGIITVGNTDLVQTELRQALSQL